MNKIIGLTGGIGSGKTTVAKFIEDLDFPVYYSDDRAKEIVNDDEDLKRRILALLGDKSYDRNGLYDRKYVSGIVFQNSELLLKLNALIHPAVKIDFESWTAKQNTAFIFKETALLFELDLHKTCYKSVLVTAEDNLRIKRVMERDGKTYREVEAVIQKQMAEKDKVKLADFVIYNNTDLAGLKEETDRMLMKLAGLPD